MMRNQTENEDELGVARTAPNNSVKLTVSVAAVIAMTSWVVASVWWASKLDTKMEFILESQKATSTVFGQLSGRVSGLEMQVQKMEATQNDLDRNGTSGLKDLASKVSANTMRIEAFSQHGSPGEHERAINFEQRIGKLERDMAVHLETDRTKGKP